MSSRSGKPVLLFLAHRIPFPPNKGDKIRSYHMLRHLSEQFDICLGTFVDDEDDWRHCAVLRELCLEACFVERKPWLHRLLSLRGLISGEALTVKFYSSSEMQRWVNRVVGERRISQCFVFCSPMSQFVMRGPGGAAAFESIVVDLVDVDSEKWRQFSHERGGLMRWLYRREADSLLNFERRSTNMSRRTLFVSQQEAALFLERAPEAQERVEAVGNGVDTAFFNPDHEFQSPYGHDAIPLVFTGAMDYWPNIDAVIWFAENVIPLLRERDPRLEFWIVGSKPDSRVTRLARLDGVFVTGRVDDVRPFVRYALAGVAPIRVARGVQNKVLEYMAMSRAVLASPEALEGIEVGEQDLLFTCSEADDYVNAVAGLLSGEKSEAPGLRSAVLDRYAWDSRLRPIGERMLAA